MLFLISLFYLSIVLFYFLFVEKRTNCECFLWHPNLDGKNCSCSAGASDLFMQDQYINHIMNETGVTVVLRGKDSGNLGNCHAEGWWFVVASGNLYLASLYLSRNVYCSITATSAHAPIRCAFEEPRSCKGFSRKPSRYNSSGTWCFQVCIFWSGLIPLIVLFVSLATSEQFCILFLPNQWDRFAD